MSSALDSRSSGGRQSLRVFVNTAAEAGARYTTTARAMDTIKLRNLGTWTEGKDSILCEAAARSLLQVSKNCREAERKAAEPDHLLFVLETSIKAFIANCQSAVRPPLWRLHNQSGELSVMGGFYCKCICSAEQTKTAGSGLTVCKIYWLTLALDGMIR